MNEQQLTLEQQEFLAKFSANGVAGRKILCGCAHALVGLGMIGGAITGVAAGISSVLKLLHGH